jgi:Lipocalin-like domain
MTTSTDTDLRNYIVGAWVLESYESCDIDRSNVHYPLGPDARGIIMYTANGYMSAQLMRSDRPLLHIGDLAAAETRKWPLLPADTSPTAAPTPSPTTTSSVTTSR